MFIVLRNNISNELIVYLLFFLDKFVIRKPPKLQNPFLTQGTSS